MKKMPVDQELDGHCDELTAEDFKKVVKIDVETNTTESEKEQTKKGFESKEPGQALPTQCTSLERLGVSSEPNEFSCLDLNPEALLSTLKFSAPCTFVIGKFRSSAQKHNLVMGEAEDGSSMSLPAEGGTCSICLQEFLQEHTILSTKCSHHFHHSCLSQWVRQNANSTTTCPICRRALNRNLA